MAARIFSRLSCSALTENSSLTGTQFIKKTYALNVIANSSVVDPDSMHPDPAFQVNPDVLMTKNRRKKLNRIFFFTFS
jgi:hypothetical protein